jgi:hypothetical protein
MVRLNVFGTIRSNLLPMQIHIRSTCNYPDFVNAPPKSHTGFLSLEKWLDRQMLFGKK